MFLTPNTFEWAVTAIFVDGADVSAGGNHTGIQKGKKHTSLFGPGFHGPGYAAVRFLSHLGSVKVKVIVFSIG